MPVWIMEHFYSEFARAEKGAQLWRQGDLEGYGRLLQIMIYFWKTQRNLQQQLMRIPVLFFQR